MANARRLIADFWDELTTAWLSGADPLPDPLGRWYASYEGRGAGLVTRKAFAEPYVGDLRGTPRMVILGLNPGRAFLRAKAADLLGEDPVARRALSLPRRALVKRPRP